MKKILMCLIITGVFFNFVYSVNLKSSKEMLVKIHTTKPTVQDLIESGVYIYEVKDAFIVGAVTDEVLIDISTKGYRFDIIIPDMVKYHESLAPGSDFGRFHSYQEVVDTFNIIAQDNPNLVTLDTIGWSIQNRVLLAMKITDNALIDEHEPRILWDGTTHGNENIGTEVCLYLVRHLLQNYGVDPVITNFVNTREIWIIPIVNPDGMVSRQRYNGNGVDLNRDYGYVWDAWGGSPGPFSQPEVIAIRNFSQLAPFVMWTTYHSGTEAAMWPWAYSTMAPYDSVFLSLLCHRYSYHTGLPPFQICRELYEVHGSSADYGYGAEGAMMVCPELCSPHVPDTSRIELLCQQNLNANLELLQRSSHGIRGRIYDSISNQPIRAMIEIQPPNFPIYTDTNGYYFRYAHQGTYSIKVIANGYTEKTITDVIVPSDTYTIVDVPLVSDTTIATFAYRCVSCNIEDPSNHSNTSLTIFALGPRDNQRLSLGVRGWAAFDMQNPIINGPGYDFTIYEDDSDAEACSVFVSNDWNGPWHFCGFDTGTSSYDLSRAGIGMARYVRIIDDGDGVNGPTGGFDFDAIEAMVVNAPALGLENLIVFDSLGNNNSRFDPGETIELVINLTNFGRLPALAVTGQLTENDAYVDIIDSLGSFGDILPDSTRNNNSDRFVLSANFNTPTEHIANFKLYLNGTGYQDSVQFMIRIGEFTITDPIPDGPREPALYWAYDDVDTSYSYHPIYNWIEIKDLGTRLSFSSNDEVKLVNLPVPFGPWYYYGNRYTQVSISADGWIAAGSNTTPNYRNSEIPNSGSPNAYVALNFDDLYPNNSGSGGIYYYHDEANNRFIIEYDSVPYYNPRSVMDKFELIIYDTTMTPQTGDNILIAQYQTSNRLSSSTVGIEDPTGLIGIQCLYNETRHRGCAPWEPGKAIRFSTDAPIVSISEQSQDLSKNTMIISPNPFRTSTVIRVPFSVMSNIQTKLNIFDITGKLVKSFDLSMKSNNQSTDSQIIWDGKDIKGKKVSAGIYFIKLDAENQGLLKKVVLTR